MYGVFHAKSATLGPDQKFAKNLKKSMKVNLYEFFFVTTFKNENLRKINVLISRYLKKIWFIEKKPFLRKIHNIFLLGKKIWKNSERSF